ncbi:MAG: leucine-rich repeat protein [Oscillospiraceae bacterium]|nr:leucine-rich repeat protein [Oscillospiraceae bacterium]
MKTTKLMAALLAAAMMTAGGSLLPVSAETETTWKYENCGDYITITGGDVNASTLIIPEEIDGLPVTCIDSCAFEQYTALTSVVIPDSVTTIGESAFAECGNLVTVVLPEGVEAILGSTFYGCTSLSNITLPDTVTSIGNFAFYNCASMDSLTLPESVEEIGYSVFTACESLKELAFPEGVTVIGQYMFRDCAMLHEVTIPSTVVSIESSAFSGCEDLSYVNYGSNAAAWDAIAIENYNESLKYAVIRYADGTASDGSTWQEEENADLALADLSGDGMIDAVDASLILQYAADKGAGSTQTLMEFLNAKGYRTE